MLQSSWALLGPGFHLLGWRRLWPWHLDLPFPDSCAPAGGVSYLITQLSTLTFDHLKLFICFHVHILPSVSSPPSSCLQICEWPFPWRTRSALQGWPQSSVLRHPQMATFQDFVWPALWLQGKDVKQWVKTIRGQRIETRTNLEASEVLFERIDSPDVRDWSHGIPNIFFSK